MFWETTEIGMWPPPLPSKKAKFILGQMTSLFLAPCKCKYLMSCHGRLNEI